MNNNGYLIHLEAVSKNFRRGSETIHALHEANLSVHSGEFIAVVGHSGSGKTTLMNIIGCLDRPTSGSVRIADRQIQNLPENQLTQIRKIAIGFVFQQFFLIPTLTVLQNVMLPGLFARKNVEKRAHELLGLVGLGNRLTHLPDQLSGGEMQRVAIARGLINDPQILLADEPTGNLDSHNAEKIISMFEQFNRTGLTIVMVTHNADIVTRCSRTVHIEDGCLT
jgi:putative ABC transport system ATP-binding protein